MKRIKKNPIGRTPPNVNITASPMIKETGYVVAMILLVLFISYSESRHNNRSLIKQAVLVLFHLTQGMTMGVLLVALYPTKDSYAPFFYSLVISVPLVMQLKSWKLFIKRAHSTRPANLLLGGIFYLVLAVEASNNIVGYAWYIQSQNSASARLSENIINLGWVCMMCNSVAVVLLLRETLTEYRSMQRELSKLKTY